jgi:hypothetical protein
MRIIYKYEIPVEDEFILDLPLDSEVLCVQVQKGKPYIWVSCDYHTVSACPPLGRNRNFCLRGTGFVFEDKSNTERYIGTFQFDGFVGHLFELPE